MGERFPLVILRREGVSLSKGNANTASLFLDFIFRWTGDNKYIKFEDVLVVVLADNVFIIRSLADL